MGELQLSHRISLNFHINFQRSKNMEKNTNDKIKYINFDAIYLQYLYNGAPGVCSWIIGDAASRLEGSNYKLFLQLEEKIPTYWKLPDLIKAAKDRPKRNYLVSCRLDDFLKNATSDKKTLQRFAVKVALMSIIRNQKWAVANRRLLVSRLAGYRTAISEEILLNDKNNNWGRLLTKTSKLWRVIKQKLIKEQGFTFITPVGCRGFVFGFLPADQLQYEYDCWLIDRNATEEQKQSVMENLGIPNDKPTTIELNLDIPNDIPNEKESSQTKKGKKRKIAKPPQMRPIYRDADQDFSKPETFT